LVNSSGAVGCHFDLEATRILACECARILRPEGLATIDSGRQGTDGPALIAIFRRLGFCLIHSVRSCWLDRYRHLCFRKATQP